MSFRIKCWKKNNDCVDDKDLVELLGGIRCLLNVLGDFLTLLLLL